MLALTLSKQGRCARGRHARGSELGHSAMIKRDTHERNPLRGVPACLPSRIEAEGDSAGEAVLALRR